MSHMTLTENVLAQLRDCADNSIELLVLSPPAEEVQTRTQQTELILEATRVATEEGSVVTDGPLADFLHSLMEPFAEEEDDYVPYIGEVLEIMGRGDVNTEQFNDGEDVINPEGF